MDLHRRATDIRVGAMEVRHRHQEVLIGDHELRVGRR
jgi:hypothetical protein